MGGTLSHSPNLKAERGDQCSESSEGACVGDVCCIHSVHLKLSCSSPYKDTVCREGEWNRFSGEYTKNHIQ